MCVCACVCVCEEEKALLASSHIPPHTLTPFTLSPSCMQEMRVLSASSWIMAYSDSSSSTSSGRPEEGRILTCQADKGEREGRGRGQVEKRGGRETNLQPLGGPVYSESSPPAD